MEKVEDVTEVKAPGAYKPRAKKKDVESVHTEPGNHGRNRNAGILPIARLSDIRALSMFGANVYMVPPSHNYYRGFYPGMDPYNPYSGGFHPSNRRMSRGRGHARRQCRAWRLENASYQENTSCTRERILFYRSALLRVCASSWKVRASHAPSYGLISGTCTP